MSKDPLVDAQQALAIAVESVGRARRFYDYMGKSFLKQIHESLIENSRRLNTVTTDIREAEAHAEDNL